MKTLELKHLDFANNGVVRLTRLPHWDFENVSLQDCELAFNGSSKEPYLRHRGVTFGLSQIKCYKRPLSQLPQDEKTCAEINLLLEPNGLEINNFLLLKNTYEAVCISWQEMQEVLNILYREHYDVFGLIEQELAIKKL